MKMLLVGFFENISSERGIAARCADTLSIRSFLPYAPTEETPLHSSFTRIRQRFAARIYRDVFGVVLAALKQNELHKRKRLGMDASILEANASLRTIEHRLTGEDWHYVKRLAAVVGVNADGLGAVRPFDQKSTGRKTSNEWHNPHDPDAKIGRTMCSSTRMVYQPEHLVDLETGAIVDADIRPDGEHDTDEIAERLIDAEERMNRAIGQLPNACTIESLTSGKGYFQVSELVRLQRQGIRTIISDPIEIRRTNKLLKEERAAVRSARRSAGASVR